MLSRWAYIQQKHTFGASMELLIYVVDCYKWNRITFVLRSVLKLSSSWDDLPNKSRVHESSVFLQKCTEKVPHLLENNSYRSQLWKTSNVQSQSNNTVKWIKGNSSCSVLSPVFIALFWRWHVCNCLHLLEVSSDENEVGGAGSKVFYPECQVSLFYQQKYLSFDSL